MRGKSFRGAWLLAAFLALAPGAAWAQFGAAGYAPADPQLPVPLGSTRPEDGGPFVFGEYLMYRESIPLKDQTVAVHGFIAVDDKVPGVPPGFGGVFIGSRSEALNTHQASGPNSYRPGFETGIGYKLRDGSAISFNWMYLTDYRTRADATLTDNPLINPTGNFSETFLTAFVTHFPPEYAGPQFKVNSKFIDPTITDPFLRIFDPFFKAPFAVYGIWNGAAVMTISYEMRFQQYELNYRVPIYETECYRCSGLVGPRFAWLWDQFLWRTTDIDVNGLSSPEDVAIYTNTVSNRMYGIHLGLSNEWYLGSNGGGGYACMLDVQCAGFVDAAREIAKYERGDKFGFPTPNKRTRLDWKFVPEVQAFCGLMWYPYEFIQVQVGYDLMLFFNTVASKRPIDFNYSSIDPKWEGVLRTFDGWRVGMALTF